MNYNGINFLFTNLEAKNDFANMDKSFLYLISEFFKFIGVKTVSINSILQNSNPSANSYHKYGQALDIHTVQYFDGDILSFNSRDANYSSSHDLLVYDYFKSFFQKYNFEYISPAKIHTGLKNDFNLYLQYSREKKTAVLNKMINENLPYEINRNHLHHLHLAVNPNPNAKILKTIKYTGLTLAAIVLAINIFKN